MTAHGDPDERLESLVGNVLRDAGRPRAPATLEQRVFDELRRRRERSWLQHGFSHWPMVIRVACVGVCVIAMLTLLWVGAAPPAALTGGGELFALLLSRVPTPWVYTVLGAGTLLYAALFGLGATAYCTLYLRPLNHR